MRNSSTGGTRWFVIVLVVLVMYAVLSAERCTAGITIQGVSGPFSLGPQSENNPSWSPDGTKIAFSYGNGYTGSGNPDGKYIVTMTADGQAIRGPGNPLVNDVHWDNHSPDWGPNAGPYPNWIAYGGTRVGPAYIARVNPADGTSVKIENTIGGHPQRPKWRPDGEQIAYLGGDWHGSPSPYNICLTDPDGSFHENLTGGIMTLHGEGIHGLSWSPDGSQIVFTQNGVPGLFVLDVATPAVSPLPGFPSGLTASAPVWSWDGDSILFTSDDGLYDYQISSQTTTQLISGPGNYLGDWHSVAGLVFASTRTGTPRIYTAAPIPAPGAFLLSSIGVGFVGWLRRHRTL